MFSLDLTLNDFVCPIAICQSEADLENILQIFERTNFDTLAIPIKKNNWGIVKPQKLVALLAKSRQWHTVSMGGYPKNLTDRENFTATKQNLNCLIEPVTVYQADTLVVNFLHQLKDNSLDFSQEVYLIADRTGQLKGKLDLSRLLKYIGTKYNQSKVNLSLPGLQNPLINLIDAIALPFKIETSTGKDIYFNQCWQESFPSNKDKLTNQPKTNVSIANWWIEQQLAQAQPDRLTENNSSVSRINNHRQNCCLGDQYHWENRPNILFSEIVADNLSQGSQPQANPLQQAAVSYSTSNTDFNSPVSSDDVRLSAKKWHYLKVPINLSLPQSHQSTTSTYWLVLAIDSSMAKFQERETTDCSSIASLAIVEKLLATIVHELKSPLTGIVGLSSLLKAQKLGSLNQRQIHYTQLIHHSGQKLVSVINDLLELTSLTTRKIDLKSEPIKLESWIAQLYQQVLTKLKLIVNPQGSQTQFEHFLAPNDDVGSQKALHKRPADFRLAQVSRLPLQREHLTEELGQPIVTPRLQLHIEPKLTTAIGDRARLSAIVSHLMLEVIQFSNFAQSQEVHVKIKNVDQNLAIVISNSAVEIPSIPLSESEPDFIDSNIQLDIIIAKYLATIIGAEIETTYLKNNCQFTLLLPDANLQLDNLKSKPEPSSPIERNNLPQNLTILCLYPEPELVDLKLRDPNHVNFNLKNWVEQDWSNSQKDDYRHRIIEADGLEQAHTLARIWQLDALVLDGYQITNCEQYLRSLQQSVYLSALPLIVLDTKTTEAANQIEGLNVYPCLLPAECRSIEDLVQVVQIATNRNFNR